MGSPTRPLTLAVPGQPQPLQPGEFTSASNPSTVSFRLLDIEAPSALYIARDDQVFAFVYSTLTNETITINARVLTIDGVIMPIQTTITMPVAGVGISSIVSGVEGFLLSLSAVGSTALQRGLDFVRIWLNRGKVNVLNTSQLLMSGYVGNQHQRSWPGSPIEHPFDGAGGIIVNTVGNPAAGADWVYSTTVVQISRVLMVCAKLTTSAAVANRQVEIVVTNSGGAVLFRTAALANIVASTTAIVSAGNVSTSTPIVSTDVVIPLPEDCWIPNQGSILTNTVGIQAGDQWSNISVTTMQYMYNV